MIKFYRRIIFLVIICICLIYGCDGGSDTNNSYPVVVLSDVHFNPFYDETLFQQLVTADATEMAGIFETSNIKDISTYGQDTNYPLLILTLQSIKQNLGTSPIIIFTGDILGHNLAQTFFELYGSEDTTAMINFLDKTVAFFTALVKSYIGNIPVMFVLGNSDSYTGLTPDNTFLSTTAEIYYSNWIGNTADHQTFIDTFEAGGYYSAEPLGTDLVVIALNTLALSTLQLTDNESQVQAELVWLDTALSSAMKNNQKVWLLMHAPPGVYTGATAGKLDDQGRLTSAEMILKPNYQKSLLQILSKYSDIITMILAGHTHMDEFRNIFEENPLSSSGSLEITPGIAPYFNNNPAYKIFTFSNDSFTPINYKSLYYDLASLPAQFDDYYTFSTAYFDNLMSSLLDEALVELYPALDMDKTKQELFRTYYYSGSSYSNVITNTNWKVYWCAIVNMTEQNFINRVNSL